MDNWGYELMKHYWHASLMVAILSASALSSGCATLMDERVYVDDTVTRDALTTQSSQPETESLAPDVRKLYAARLTSGPYAQPTSAFYNPDAANRGPERLSDIEARAMMDVVVEFQWDKDDLVPAYRFIMTPYKKLDSQHANAWSSLAVITLKHGKYSSAMLVAPLPPASQRLVNGQIVTPWTFCEACFESGKNGARVPEKNRKSQYRILRSNFVTEIDSPHLGFTSNTGIEKLRFMEADPHSKVGDAVFVTGATAVKTARQEFVSRSKAREQRLSQIQRNNRIYKNFIEEKYTPVHMYGHQDRAGPDCKRYFSRPNTNQGVKVNQEFIDANYAFIDCAQRVLQQYDIKPYVAMYPDLAKREQMLWERTSGIKREKVITPEQMVAWGQDEIENAYAGIEKIQARIDGLYANQARKQAQSNAMSAILAGLNQSIAQQKAENNQRQRQLDLLQAQARRPRPAAPSRPIPTAKPGPQTTAQTQSSNSPPPAAGTPEQASNTSSDNPQTSGDDTSSSAGPAKLVQVAEADQTTTQITPPRPPEKIGAEPVAGGEQGCVALVEANRYPGKSALSSCLYSEPERESLEMKFRNSCGVPVNVSIDLLHDSGETRTSAEYNIKPGKMRTTNGYCGATRYAYKYEETSESVRARSE